ncbi:MAG: BFO_1060 family glycosyltransferase [Fluviicola sp.]
MKSVSEIKKKGHCYLVSNETRDYYLLLPIIYFLETYKNYSISLEFIWDAHKIKTEKPDLVILPNTRGHNLYYEVGKYCIENDILVFSHDSEGNFNNTEKTDYWGYNKTKELFCPIVFTWNLRIKNYLNQSCGIPIEKIKISGSPIFDKYIYLKPKTRTEILSKYKKDHFTKVVGYAGWAFGKIYNKELNDVLVYLDKGKEEGINWLTNQRDFVENCLKTLIELHPDTLFILKKHPRENFESDFRDSRNEMNRLKDFPNVLYLKDEEEIQDLIGISDLWMAFESTSIMEAWLLNVPTMLINEIDDFKRVSLHQGSFKVNTIEKAIQAFEKLFSENDKSFFNPSNIVEKRNKIFADSIGYSDGLNHLRAINFFSPYLENNSSKNKKIKTNYKFLRLYLLLHIGKFFYSKRIFSKLPKFKKTIWVFENYKLTKIKNQKKSVYEDLAIFYKKMDLKNKIESNQIWNEIE